VQGVTLASLHAAKGLEWDAVFLVGLVDGTVPITHAVTEDEIEEERRLLYVGVTRARERLFLSWASARSPGGRAGRRPSRFLDGLVGAPAATGPRAARRPRRAGPARCRGCGAALSGATERRLRRCSRCPGDMDEQLFDRLREWRLAKSRADEVPAYVVFTDATLTAIAEARPASTEELADIPGIGPRKLEQYADEVLALVHAPD
jgi:DNA helicase-2/ATP-dependent DNA helicase PcrA